ncbi:MAG: hypothetical protein DRQ10_03070 [Candidatus Hydrothermota bacterium]|nr:MAG: hypothetical protein DRQ10_03070 [Candidatus Hydrothermae bacterium]
MIGLVLSVLLSLNGVEVQARDVPDDQGGAVELRVNFSRPLDISKILIYRVANGDTVSKKVAELDVNGQTKIKYIDKHVKNGVPVQYTLFLISQLGDTLGTVRTQMVEAKPSIFNKRKTFLLLAVLSYIALLIYFMSQARRGRELYLRPIAGLIEVDNAIGRATEMGRPILFSPGLSTISDVATIAALNILAYITRKVAAYETRIIVPVYDPIVYTIAQEVVKDAYTAAGRPDLYRAEDVFFLTSRQFAYAAGVSGIMVREKTAANFFMGYFFAESLILAETGASTGAIQIAGTDAVTQLPFFITACDYTLMGEELYAAGAYLAKDPRLTATIKGQDVMKATLATLLLLITLIAFIGPKLGLHINWETFKAYIVGL